MGVAMEIPKEYGYVILVLAFYCLLNFWTSSKSAKPTKSFISDHVRDRFGEHGRKLFNCMQRGHQNSLGTLPVFFPTLLVGGFHHPLITTCLGVVCTVSRFFYFKGYSTGVPNNRLKLGVFFFLGMYGLIICTASFGINLLLGG